MHTCLSGSICFMLWVLFFYGTRLNHCHQSCNNFNLFQGVSIETSITNLNTFSHVPYYFFFFFVCRDFNSGRSPSQQWNWPTLKYFNNAYLDFCHIPQIAMNTEMLLLFENSPISVKFEQLGLKNNCLVVLHNFFGVGAGRQIFFFFQIKSKLCGIIASIYLLIKVQINLLYPPPKKKM